jgi:hypothetical protein
LLGDQSEVCSLLSRSCRYGSFLLVHPWFEGRRLSRGVVFSQREQGIFLLCSHNAIVAGIQSRSTRGFGDIEMSVLGTGAEAGGFDAG